MVVQASPRSPQQRLSLFSTRRKRWLFVVVSVVFIGGMIFGFSIFFLRTSSALPAPSVSGTSNTARNQQTTPSDQVSELSVLLPKVVDQEGVQQERSQDTGAPSVSVPPSVSTVPLPAFVELDPPFISQAPNGEWSDQVFQDACEEASVLMAKRWIERNPARVSRAEATGAIQTLVAWQRERGRYTHDLSAADTAKLLRDYSGHQAVETKTISSFQAIQQELAQGHLVIVPADGRLLPSPYYTPPGPVHHMLVIKGYDKTKRQFITQDTGTVTKGENFRFPEQAFYDAIRDYPTGFHAAFENIRKVMIVVTR